MYLQFPLLIPLDGLLLKTDLNTINYISLSLQSINNHAPKYISDLYVNVSSHKYSSRSSTRGDIIPKSKMANTQYLSNSFSNKGKDVWNMIPGYIRNT